MKETDKGFCRVVAAGPAFFVSACTLIMIQGIALIIMEARARRSL